MKRWQRPTPCWCGGYWFPHRKTSGSCEHNPDIMVAANIVADRLGMTMDERIDLLASLAWDHPGIASKDCPF